MVSEFFEPPRDVLVGLMFADIVDEKCAHSASVVCRCDGAIPLLPSCIPDLCFDGLCVHLDGSCREFNTDRGLRIKIEFVACETAQEIRFADARVTDKHDWEIISTTVPVRECVSGRYP